MDHNIKFNSVTSKLPPGFIFQPTDEEIIFQYLARKIFSFPLPADVVPEISSFAGFEPWALPGEVEQDKYFFCKKECSYRNYVSGGSRVTCDGFWRAVGHDKLISCSRRKSPIVGIKKTFVFFKGTRSCNFARTDWYMHLHSIAVRGNTKKHSSKECMVQIGKWDLCHIFSKKRGAKFEVCGHNGRFISRHNENLFVTREEKRVHFSCSSTSSSSSSSSDSDTECSVLSEDRAGPGRAGPGRAGK
ncbi:NAC domain containing protein 83 [Striga hermonthica]|uniref:NAC domain containing protein 83 n=1 Tax=Striga hermonthica TaxID=68872 RepID=A0A9N7MID9_STRHE|nr:NAC domain containing protein 83 [Striga hermonthica]